MITRQEIKMIKYYLLIAELTFEATAVPPVANKSSCTTTFQPFE